MDGNLTEVFYQISHEWWNSGIWKDVPQPHAPGHLSDGAECQVAHDPNYDIMHELHQILSAIISSNLIKNNLT